MFWKRKPHSDVADSFVVLMRVAEEEPEIRQTLLTLTHLPPAKRRLLLTALTDKLRGEGAAEDVIQALETLHQDAVADQVAGMLQV